MTPEESSKALDSISDAISQHCPLTFADADSLALVADKIKSYTEKLDRLPGIEMVVAWARSVEDGLQRKADEAVTQQRAEQERIDARNREREEYLSSPNIDRQQAIADLKARAPHEPERRTFTPARQYSQKELDAMSSDEYGVKILGRNTIADRNGQGTLRPDAREKEILKKRIMRSKKSNGSKADQQMRAALRRQVRENLF